VRAYSITISKPGSTEPIRPAAFARLNLPDTYSSVVNGRNLPGALDIELQMQSWNYAVAKAGSWLRIYGVPNEELAQAAQLAGNDIIVKCGMQRGLPLAKPEQYGVIFQGKIFQSFGNLRGTDRTLELIVTPGGGIGEAPINLSWNLPKGTSMAEAIRTTLETGLNAPTTPTPGSVGAPTGTTRQNDRFKFDIQISDELKFSDNKTGTYTKLSDFSRMIKSLTTQKQFAGIKTLGNTSGNNDYRGVDITVKEKTVTVYDNTKKFGQFGVLNPKEIAFEDLLGQPTWISFNQINFACTMRADLYVGAHVRLPSRLRLPYVLTTPGAAFPGSPSRNTSTFEGVFQILEMFHFGRFRQPDSASWNTSFFAVFIEGSIPQTPNA
jgi:hypothetical protein